MNKASCTLTFIQVYDLTYELTDLLESQIYIDTLHVMRTDEAICWFACLLAS